MYAVASKGRGRVRRGLAPWLAWLVVFSQGCWRLPVAELNPGLMEFRAESVRLIGPARVHLDAGNLSLDRVDMSLDTRLGRLEHGAVYNSASGRWLWRHEMTYFGGIFTDASGAEHDVSVLANGAAIAGTYWVKLDDTRVRTKGGRVHVFDAAGGRLRSTHWADGPFPMLRYEAEEVLGVLRTTRIEQCIDETTCSEQFALRYDQGGCLDEVSDRAGRVARYEIDATCRIETARSTLDVEQGWLGTHYEYGGAGRLRAVTNSEGERVEFGYEGGRITRVRRVGEAGPEHRMVYVFDDETGRSLTLVVTPAGSIWRYEFDERGRLLRRVSPEGVVVEQGWSGLRPAWRRDAAGSIWQFEYRNDDLNRFVDPGGHVTLVLHASTAVDRVHPRRRAISSVHDSLGVREIRSYDPMGRIIDRVDGLGEATLFSWDALGQLASMTLPDGRVVSYHDYGEHGHPARIERGELVERRLFDAVGNLEKSNSLRGELAPGRPGMIRRRFDAGRNVAEVWTAEGQPESIAYAIAKTYLQYRSDGRPTYVARPHGGDLEFVHDDLGRLVARRERVDGEWQTTSIDFGIQDRPARVIRPNGMTTEFSWDLDERTTRVVRTLAGAETEDVSFSWVAGRVVRVDDVAHRLPESIVYDAVGRVQSVAHPTGGVTEFEWDGRGRATVRRVRAEADGPVLFELTRTWSATDRLLRSEIDGELLVARVHAAGQLTAEVFGNGLERSYTHDPETGEVIRTQTARAFEIIEDTTIDRVGCWTEKICFDVKGQVNLAAPGEAGSWKSGEEHYEIHWPMQVMGDDALPAPRLRTTNVNPIQFPGDGDRFRFDALGNFSGIQPKGQSERAFSFNLERNRLLAGGVAGWHAYDHDEAGFVRERDGVEMSWTAAGRIASIGDDNQFIWDGLGRPIEQTRGGETIRFGFGGIVVVDESGWPMETEIDGIRVALGRPGRLFRHHDFRGNVQFVSDESGRITRHHVYDAFGSLRVHDADGSTRPPRTGEHGFARGVQLDELQVVGARLYDPDVGRFLSPDPIEHVLSDFAYTSGDPVRLWDPGGTHAVGTPGPDGASGLSQRGEATVLAGEVAQGVGQVIVVAGIGAQDPRVVLVGVVVLGTGIVLESVGSKMEAAPVGSGALEELPVGESTDEAVGEASSSACAPENLRPRRTGPRPLLLLFMALVLVLWHPRRRWFRD